ncbi:MAG TPA: alpha/beta hydrolase [Ohtaekwangia sp.]|nr:alpha/beta hydrolase [Ohtaekwangia sp.]
MKKLIPLILGRCINLLSAIAPRYAGQIGFKVFCYPFRGTLKPYHKKFLSTAKTSILQHEGQRIQVYQWGSGAKKIVFFHGWQSHSYRWKNYIEQFPANEYTLYALDAPGHGLSTGSFLTVPLYSVVIEKLLLQLGEVEAVISHSLGAFTILYTLSRLPLLPVKKTILLAPPGEATEFFNFYRTTLRLNDRSVRHIVNHFEEVISKKVDFFSASKFAATITQPGLIIHDEDDDETSHLHSVAIHKSWTNSKLIITKGRGHNLKAPEILKEIVNFIGTNNTLEERYANSIIP